MSCKACNDSLWPESRTTQNERIFAALLIPTFAFILFYFILALYTLCFKVARQTRQNRVFVYMDPAPRFELPIGPAIELGPPASRATGVAAGAIFLGADRPNWGCDLELLALLAKPRLGRITNALCPKNALYITNTVVFTRQYGAFERIANRTGIGRRSSVCSP